MQYDNQQMFVCSWRLSAFNCTNQENWKDSQPLINQLVHVVNEGAVEQMHSLAAPDPNGSIIVLHNASGGSVAGAHAWLP